MVTAEVTLTEEQGEALRAMAESTGKSQEELLRDAVERLLAAPAKRQQRLENLRAARGMWKDRDDLPDFAALRAEFDRHWE